MSFLTPTPDYIVQPINFIRVFPFTSVSSALTGKTLLTREIPSDLRSVNYFARTGHYFSHQTHPGKIQRVTSSGENRPGF